MGSGQEDPARHGGASLQSRLLRLAPRRRVVGLVVAVVVAGLLALRVGDPQPVAWWAVGLALLVFGLDGHPPVRRLVDRVSGALTAVMVAVLVLGTGGVDSVFQDLYVLILVYAAVALPWSRFALDAVVVLAAASTPAWSDSVTTRFWEDLAVDFGAWLAVALLAGLVTQRLHATSADAQRLRSVVDSLQDNVTVVDAATRTVLYANQGAAAAVGLTPETMVGRDITDVTDRTTPEGLAALAQELRHSGGIRTRQVTVTHDDDTRVYETRTRLVGTDDGTEVFAVVGRDMTSAQEQHALEQRLAAIVDASDTAILSTDLHGRVQTWNPAAERLYGWTRDEAVGRQVVGLLASADEEGSPLLVTSGHEQFETLHHRRDGRTVEVAVTISAIRDNEGGVAGVALLSRDISETKRHERALAEREDRFRALAEQAQGIVYRVRLAPDLALEYVNPRVEEITGYPPEHFERHPRQLLRRIAAGQETDRPRGTAGVTVSHFRRADGTWIWLEDHHRPESDETGAVVATQGIMFDVTSRQQVEQARRRALEHQRRASTALRRTVEIQHTFLQAVSHELRTPLTSVLGFARTLETHVDRLGAEEQRDLLGRLSRNAERLAALLDDLLDLDRLTRGVLELHRAPVDLAGLCRRVVDRLDPQGHRIELALEPVVVPVDRGKVERIVDNLLRNAVKHTPPDAVVTLRLTSHDDGADLCVEDDGPGIPDDVVDTVFEPFQQGPQAASAASPGTGVGLALVREFARLHDGEAWYEDNTPAGARFCVRLPAAPSEPGPTPEDPDDVDR